jgi:hypothetical protein
MISQSVCSIAYDTALLLLLLRMHTSQHINCACTPANPTTALQAHMCLYVYTSHTL